MDKMKKMILVGLLCLTTLTATACGSEGYNVAISGPQAVTVTARDGRVVQCITAQGGGLSCDWENAR